MKYRVLKYFTDLQDGNHPYNEGDTYPRDGLKVTQERLDSLSINRNRRNEPLIVLVEEPVVEREVVKSSITKTDINRMSTADLKSLALKNGIKNAKDMTGADLKKSLIKQLEL